MTGEAVTVEQREDVAVAHLRGDVDETNTEVIASQVLDAVPPDIVWVVVDLTQVRYIDSAGVQMILDLVREHATRRRGIAFALPDTSPVATLVKITNLHEVASFFASADEAAAALRATDPDLS